MTAYDGFLWEKREREIQQEQVVNYNSCASAMQYIYSHFPNVYQIIV